jgi:Spy/CpxP family protein refolding chaperone
MRKKSLFGQGGIMKRALFAALLLSLALALPAFAVESNAPPNAPPKAPAANFDQRKAQILKHIDERNTKLQQEKDCVQAAKNDNDLKACREKFAPPRGPGGPRGPRGSGSPPAPEDKPLE